MAELRVWLGNQAQYADRLRGEWVNVGDPDELSAVYNRVTYNGRDEHFIGDVEGPAWFREMATEWADIDVLSAAAGIAEALDDESVSDDLFSAWWDIVHTSYARPHEWDPRELVNAARDALMAEGDGDADAAMSYAEAFCSMDEWDYSHLDPRSCIDWDAYARNLQNDYSFVRVGGTVFILHIS
jgi:hypothetical protein